MATTTAYLNKSLAIIYKSEWRERRKDEDYWLLHQVDYKHLRIQATFSGEILNAHVTARSKWAPFELVVYYKDEDGSLKRDDLACENFITLEDLQKGYEAFLDEYAPGTKPASLGMGRADPVPVAPVVYEEDDDDEDEKIVAKEPVKETEPEVYVDPNANKPKGGQFVGDW